VAHQPVQRVLDFVLRGRVGVRLRPEIGEGVGAAELKGDEVIYLATGWHARWGPPAPNAIAGIDGALNAGRHVADAGLLGIPRGADDGGIRGRPGPAGRQAEIVEQVPTQVAIVCLQCGWGVEIRALYRSGKLTARSSRGSALALPQHRVR
jgi:hypothetical protein